MTIHLFVSLYALVFQFPTSNLLVFIIFNGTSKQAHHIFPLNHLSMLGLPDKIVNLFISIYGASKLFHLIFPLKHALLLFTGVYFHL